MLQQLISLNPDLKQLWDEGYDLEIDGGYLLTHQIPYVTPNKQVKLGTLVCVLTLVSPKHLTPPSDHTIFFTGETPCNADGSPMTAIINNSNRQQLTQSILVNHYFSSKPLSGKYVNYYDKIRTYAEILSSQARVIDSTVTTKPNKNKAA
jgi:hypothetical protein